MKKKIIKIAQKELQGNKEKQITRKEAIKKTSFIAASAATTMLLLGTPKYAAASPAPAPPPPTNTQNPSGSSSPIWKD